MEKPRREESRGFIAAGYSSDFNGEAYKTVAGQNSNNSVRVSDEFMQAVEKGGKWHTKARTDGSVIETYEAKDALEAVAQAAWACADPGVQYDTTINDWHTCAGTDRIHASNPCSEYMFLNDTACNLVVFELGEVSATAMVLSTSKVIVELAASLSSPKKFSSISRVIQPIRSPRIRTIPSIGSGLRQSGHASHAQGHCLMTAKKGRAGPGR